MKKLFLAAVAVMMTAFSVNAQVRVESPHPDLDIKVTRCAYASGTVVIDMVLTNFGKDESIRFYRDVNGFEVTAYDDEGNMYTRSNSNISLGLLSQGLSSGAAFVLPQDVPLKFRVELQDISSNATKFALIKLIVSSEGAMALNWRGKPIVIRNLEWAK